jgi:hypothetical protein
MDTSRIAGHGADADPARRPGIPEYRAPHPEPHAQVPTSQQSEVKQLSHQRRHKSYPPVWGTAQPPRGVSGALRKYAYRFPDHWTRHWTVLMLADRVDVWEHRLRKSFPAMAGILGAVVIGRFLRRAR